MPTGAKLTAGKPTRKHSSRNCKLPAPIINPTQRVLIGILSCHKYAYRRQSQRETWLPRLTGADYRYFIGNPQGGETEPDVVYLDVPDTYETLPLKTRGVIKYALANNYDYLFKTDDDVYIVPDRLLTSGFETADYTGFNGWRERLHYVFGGGYWLSRRAMEIIDAEPITKDFDTVEDRYIGNILFKHGIIARCDKRYVYAGGEANTLTDTIVFTATRDVMTPGYMYALDRLYHQNEATKHNQEIVKDKR